MKFQPVAEAGRVRLVADGDEAVVSGDERLLDRVVTNLVDNAVKHSPPGGEVRVTLASGREILLTVSDDGPGIPPEHVPHLFVRFFRGDPARQRGEGTGLGLAIAKAGAEAHHGRLEFVGNSPGATFRLVLPVNGAHGLGATG